MPSINTIFLKWDGLTSDRPKDLVPATAWCNSRDVGDGTYKVPAPEKTEPVSAPHNGKGERMGAILSSPRAQVSMVSFDKVIAPIEEYALVEAKIKNIDKAGQLIFQIHDKDKKLVYAERLTQQQIRGLPSSRQAALATAPRLATNDQDGADVAANKQKERAANTWATPDKSPYRVTVIVSRMAVTTKNKVMALPSLDVDANGRMDDDHSKWSVPKKEQDATVDPDQVSVLVDSIEVGLMPWEELYRLASKETSLDYPTGKSTAITTMWVQYKLNALGYHAGPIDGNASDVDLKKAITRYHQGDKDLTLQRYEKDGFAFKQKAVTLVDTITQPLIDKLKADANPRTTFDDAKVFSGEKPAGKVYIDADRLMQDAGPEFAFTKREAAQSLKSKLEGEWYSTPRIPMRGKVMVKSRAGDKKWVPEAVMTVPVEWSWTDTAQDLAVFPAFKADEPTRSKEYVESALARVKTVIPSDYHNARTVFGGLISGDKATDKRSAFRAVGGFVLTPGAESDTWGVKTIGGAVYFTPSTIGGDNYTLEAKVGSNSKKTGKIEVWRRAQIACHVSWSAAAPSAVWDEVVKEYLPAFIEVVPPKLIKPLKDVADVTLKTWFVDQLKLPNFAAPDQKFSDDFYDPRDVSKIVAVTKTTADKINEKMRKILDANGHLKAWEDNGTRNPVKEEVGKATPLLTMQWRNGKDPELSDLAKDALIEQAFTHFNAELTRIKMDQKPKPEDMPPEVKGNFLKEGPWIKANTTVMFKDIKDVSQRKLKPFVADQAAIDKATREAIDQRVRMDLVNPTQIDLLLHLRRIVGPGVMLLEIDPHAPVTVGGKPYVSMAIPSMSPGGELVIFNRAMYGAYKLYMLFAHEMAHCFFLKHHKNADPYEPWDHDQKDENCMMSYAYEEGTTGNMSRGVGEHYKDGKFTPHFCGKCALLLRGWNIRAKDPKNPKQDVLPHFFGLEPLPRLKKVEGTIEVPSPVIIQTAADELMKTSLGEGDVSSYWIKGTGVSEPGRIMAIANPTVIEDRIEWEVIPMRSFPEGTPLGKPLGTMGVPKYTIKLSDENDQGLLGGWDDSITMWSETAALTSDDGVPLVVSCPGYTFTDLMHEACHFFQKWGADQAFYEGVTEVFAGLLSVGVRDQLTKAGQGQHKDRFIYNFNASYSEVTLSAIDLWLPQLGMRKLSQIYVKNEDAGAFQALFKDKPNQLKRILDVTRDNLHERDLMTKASSGDPLVSGTGDLRKDLADAVEQAGDLELPLRATIKSFLDGLDAQAANLTAQKKSIIAGKDGLAKTYAKARMVRLTAKQMANVRILREARHMKERLTSEQMSFLGTGLDTYIQFNVDALNKLCQETGETEVELAKALPDAPYVPNV